MVFVFGEFIIRMIVSFRKSLYSNGNGLTKIIPVYGINCKLLNFDYRKKKKGGRIDEN